jgi:hypothetical protein
MGGNREADKRRVGFIVGAGAALLLQAIGFAIATWAKPYSFVFLPLIYVFLPPSLLGVLFQMGSST